MNHNESWNRYCKHLFANDDLGLQVDISRMAFTEDDLDRLDAPMRAAIAAMHALENGAVANPDENRMVGHYWLRSPRLAPAPEIGAAIEQCVADIGSFAAVVHEGAIRPQRADGFYVVLVIGIGGSALGPQLLADALGGSEDPLMLRFIDNTDPDGIARTLAELNEMLDQTLVIVTSKSGGTLETRNGMLEVAAAYRRSGLDFARHAVAVTGEGSALHEKAVGEKWLRTFPMWDWVGGRTSVTSAVGLLPAALLGVDIDRFLSGAASCDQATRTSDWRRNPAALLAAMWHYAGRGAGERNMVVLPYRDRLALFGRYLQQLVMESLGKAIDRNGHTVHQGLTVYGNKGSTDQHAFVQQLIDGRNDFFVTFIDVLSDQASPALPVEEDVYTGDYLNGFLHGTRTALTLHGRESLTISLRELDARSLGILIALFERAVGLYADLINVNAYHQPGVEAGKRAAGATIALQRAVLGALRANRGQAMNAERVAELIAHEEIEAVFHVLEHLAATGGHNVSREAGASPWETCYAAD